VSWNCCPPKLLGTGEPKALPPSGVRHVQEEALVAVGRGVHQIGQAVAVDVDERGLPRGRVEVHVTHVDHVGPAAVGVRALPAEGLGVGEVEAHGVHAVALTVVSTRVRRVNPPASA
jgi:hypothetical protein